MEDFTYTIKNMVKMRDVAEKYGLYVKSNGKTVCPFHDDTDPSLHIYEDNYHCFSCGAHGDVIDFVKNYFGISFQQALEKINIDFALSLPIGRKLTVREYLRNKDMNKEAERKKNEKQMLEDSLTKEYQDAFDNYSRLAIQMKKHRPKSPDEAPDPRFLEALSGLENAEYRLDLAETRLHSYGAK